MTDVLIETREILIDLWGGVEHVLGYFLVGILLAALIRTWKLHVRARKHLPKLGFWAIFAATIIGMFSPLCACGVLPIAVSLMMTGMPLAPAMSLVVASPLMSIDAFMITAKMLSWDWAWAKLFAALFMGLFVGLVTHALAMRGRSFSGNLFKGEMPEGDMHDPDFTDERLACRCREQWSNKIARRYPSKFIVFWAKAAELTYHVGKYTLIGLMIEVLAERYVPYEWINAVFGSESLLAIPMIVIAAAPLHLNQYTATGMLFDIPISWGAGMAFLIGGPVTALPVMGVFLSLFKARVFWLYLSLCIGGSVIVAAAAQLLLS